MRPEDNEQSALFDWAKMSHGRYPELAFFFSIPNGGYRPIVTALKMKATGTLKGVCDTFLPVARHGKNGLFIELKIHPNKPSPEQLEFIDFVTQQGYLAVICWSAEEAIQTIEDYLGT